MVTKQLRDLGKTIVDKLKYVEPHRYLYRQHTGNRITIDTRSTTCTCSIFHSKRICKHLVAGCLKDNVQMRGLVV
mgnify:CR=1 FL=1